MGFLGPPGSLRARLAARCGSRGGEGHETGCKRLLRSCGAGARLFPGARGLPRSTPAACCGSDVPERASRRGRECLRRRIVWHSARRRRAEGRCDRGSGALPRQVHCEDKNGENRFCVTQCDTCWFSQMAFLAVEERLSSYEVDRRELGFLDV